MTFDIHKLIKDSCPIIEIPTTVHKFESSDNYHMMTSLYIGENNREVFLSANDLMGKDAVEKLDDDFVGFISYEHGQLVPVLSLSGLLAMKMSKEFTCSILKLVQKVNQDIDNGLECPVKLKGPYRRPCQLCTDKQTAFEA